MNMRDKHKWVAHKITSRHWVKNTNDYNDELEKINTRKGLPTVRKHPRALSEKLTFIEGVIFGRMVRGDYTCMLLLPFYAPP